MTSSELALTESRTLREQHVDRTEVLDKVKAVSTLPGDTHVTVDMAATFYEVPADAIESQIRRDRDELAADGLEVLTGSRLSAFKTESGYRSRAASLTLIPRRALLRLGMLLRDSEIAKAVRTQLLDGERGAVVPQSFAEALRLAADLQEKNEAQARELEAAAPKIEYVDTFLRSTDVCLFRQYAKQIGLKEKDLRTELIDRKVIFRTPIENRFSKSRDMWVTEYRYEPAAAFMGWFKEGDQPNAPRLHNGQLRTTLYVTPAGKVGIARLLDRLPSSQAVIEGASA
jgi:hypothetical protein